MPLRNEVGGTANTAVFDMQPLHALIMVVMPGQGGKDRSPAKRWEGPL